jgi:Tol biopolymer transport system component
LPYTGPGVFGAAISRNGNRLAYSQGVFDPNIWHVSLSGLGVASGPPAKLIGSTRWENAPQYSPDGKRIAFSSNRSGVYGIWISDADGSHATELFARPGSTSAAAHWSPDGQRIAFSSNFDIYVIRASGGKPVRLTTDPAEDDVPSWSRDGKWIYFGSKRTGQYEVWKVPAAGGEAVRVTRKGGGPALESPDGKSIYYIKGDWSGSLWKMPLSGGEETQVLPSVNSRAFALVKEGIYFIPEPKPDGKSSIEFLSLETGQTKAVIPVSSPVSGLSLSSDGRSLLFTQMDEAGSDLMLVENFR